MLTDAQLAMNAHEVGELGRRLGVAPLSDAAVAELLDATQGWPIAVYLGSRLGSPTKLGNVRYFTAFLDQEVLRGAESATVRLLQATAPLLDLSAELCDYVLQTDGCGQVLNRAESATLLITRSEDRKWFRLHPLLREHLQERLRLTDPSLYRTVAYRASEWCLARGYVDRAITYARESQDEDLLGVTIWEGGTEALVAGQVDRLVTWLAAVEHPKIGRSCPLALAAAWCAINLGRPDDAYRWSQAAFAAADEDWASNLQRSSVEACLALLISSAGTGGYDRSARLAAEAMRSLPDGHVVFAFSQMTTGWMQSLAGDSKAGAENLARAAKLARSQGLLGTQVEAKALQSMALLAQGDLKRGEPLVREAMAAWEERGLTHLAVSGALVSGPAAVVAAQAGQDELARAQLARVLVSVAKFGPILPWLGVALEAFASWAHALLGDQEQAALHLKTATELSRKAPPSVLLERLTKVARSSVESESKMSALSPAERRVFSLLLSRATLREVADSLFVSPETVKTQTGSIYRKLDVSSRRELQDLGDRLRIVPDQRSRRGWSRVGPPTDGT